MLVFIDESGSFTGYHDGSFSLVGALAIPNGKLSIIEKKYAKIRESLPIENGEVKGRLLKEGHIKAVTELLARNDVLFETVGTDFGILACCRFRRHRVRCFDGTGGGSWRDGDLHGSSSLRL